MTLNTSLEKIRKISTDQNGSIAVMFAAILVILVFGGGMALDYARGITARTDIQSAADSAVLAAVRAKSVDDDLGFGQLQQIAQDYFDKNIGNSLTIDSFKLVDTGDGGYRVEVVAEVKTLLTGVGGIVDLSLNVSSTAATSQSRPLELALVLDNTGSMSGHKLASLKRAGRDLIDTMLSNSSGQTKIALVPFGQYVNVGGANGNASWISVADPDDWNGCVGSRNYPLNIEDSSYASNKVTGLDNTSCGDEITPLTSENIQLKVAINNMTAGGWTYIPSGLSWGWRVLSSEAPFTEGKTPAEVHDEGGIKAIVLMTDGENTRAPSYPEHDSTDTNLANTMTNELCANVKTDEVVIYTIAFEVSDTTTKDLLKNCATQTSYYYDASNASELADAFDTIAGDLKQLRLTH